MTNLIHKPILHTSKSKRKIFPVIFLLVLILWLFRKNWLLMIGDLLIVDDELKPADVIHVIAGDEYRLDYAIHLYQQGYGNEIYLTGGGWCPIHYVHHGEVWRERAFELGVPPSDIIINNQEITSTYEEALILKNWIEHNPTQIRSVIVVSDPFQMRRVRWTYNRIFGNGTQVQMAPVTFEQTPFQRMWWKDIKSKRYVGQEYSKLVYYIVRYQLSWGSLKDWLASFDRE